MNFASPHVLWLLLAPALWLVWESSRRTRSVGADHPKILRAEAGANSLNFTAPPAFSSSALQPLPHTSSRRVRWRLQAGLAVTLLALAQPQWGRIEEPVFVQARDILIAVDLSRSMLAPDVKPSRLERARLLVTSLLEKLHGERVGLVVFSGTAFLQSPLSGDYEILREFLPALGPDYLPEGGTNFSALADTALAAFGNGSAADRFLIVLSDGEANDDDWKSRLDELKARGVRVIGLGVGTGEGAMIPDGTGQFVKDERGAVVLSRLDSSTLRGLADATGGAYADASGWVDLALLLEDTVERGQRGAFREAGRVHLAERFQWVLAPALLLLAWSFWREFPVRPGPRSLALRTDREPGNPPTTAATLLILASCLLLPPPGFAVVTRSDANGKETSPLPRLVSRLAATPNARAADWADLANETLTWGNELKSGQKPVSEGPVRDGLAAVELGTKLDAKAADWPSLRAALEKLLEKSDEQKSPQDKSDQQQPNPSKDQDQTKDQGQPKDQQPNQSQSSQSAQNQPGNPSSQQPPSSQPPDKQEQGEPSTPQNGKDQNPNPSSPSDEPPPRSSQQTLGEMNSAGDQKPPPAPDEMQQVGGGPSNARTAAANAPTDPALLLQLQKLDELRNQDSPVRLYQLMQQQEDRPPASKNHNW